MSVFVLAISCLTTSNLPWLRDLTFQVPMQYCYRIGLYFHHQAHLQLDYGFHFSTASSFLLELFLCSSAVAYSAPTDLGGSSFGVLSFCLFILFMGFSRQEYWSGLPFPSPVDHALSELSTMTRLSLVALHSMAHSFTELDKAVIQVISLDSFLWLWFHSVCPLMDENKRLVEASWLEGLAVGKSLALVSQP